MVIMAGGSGSRLWPLSRTNHPKQFLSLDGGDTMLQATIARLRDLTVDNYYVVCNEEHRFLVAEQIREVGIPASIILEPSGRNTAPAIALAALLAGESPLMLVLPADHVIKDEKSFVDTVKSAIALAKKGKLITFGVTPGEANTGYGYIKGGDQCDVGYVIEEFVEKPSSELAKTYVRSGDYFWNSGIFLFNAGLYLRELSRFRHDIFEICRASMEASKIDQDFVRCDKTIFESCPSDSIDYAVMEHTESAVVVPLNAGWSDVGSWSSLWEVSEKNPEGNATAGDVMLHDTVNSYIRTDDKLVVAVGLKDLIVVSTKDAVMIAHKNSSQDIKKITEDLKESAREELDFHREVYRPWGKYDSIDRGECYQVKRITVNPGARLSLQMHHHRAEHWVVVSGTAKVTKGSETMVLFKNESVYLPLGVVHALENPGRVNLELIEVQSGDYLGEDDIVRLDDKYGRT